MRGQAKPGSPGLAGDSSAHGGTYGTPSWGEICKERQETAVLGHLDPLEAEAEELRNREAGERSCERRHEWAEHRGQRLFELRLVGAEGVVEDRHDHVGRFGRRNVDG